MIKKAVYVHRDIISEKPLSVFVLMAERSFDEDRTGAYFEEFIYDDEKGSKEIQIRKHFKKLYP